MFNRVGCLLPRVGRHLTRTGPGCYRQYWRGRTLVPIRYGRDNIWDEMAQSFKSFENMFRDFERSSFGPFSRDLYRPSRFGEEISLNNNQFQVRLDVREFAENLNLALEENQLTVKGKFENKDAEHGTISREFTRQYTIPENVDMGTLESTISEDGILTIRGTLKAKENTAQEKVIEIQRENK